MSEDLQQEFVNIYIEKLVAEHLESVKKNILLQAQHTFVEKESEKLRAHIEELQKSHSDVQQAVITDLKQQVDDAIRAKNTAEAHINNMNVELGQLRGQVRELQETNSRSSASHSHYQETIRILEGEKLELLKQIEESQKNQSKARKTKTTKPTEGFEEASYNQ